MMWLIVAGTSFMLAAVASDPWGKRASAAALYLLGMALFTLGLMT